MAIQSDGTEPSSASKPSPDASALYRLLAIAIAMSIVMATASLLVFRWRGRSDARG